jgi:hypothetical protein
MTGTLRMGFELRAPQMRAGRVTAVARLLDFSGWSRSVWAGRELQAARDGFFGKSRMARDD